MQKMYPSELIKDEQNFIDWLNNQDENTDWVRCSPDSCPIASWLQESSGIFHITVSKKSIYIWLYSNGKIDRVERLVTPLWMANFISQVDNKEFTWRINKNDVQKILANLNTHVW